MSVNEDFTNTALTKRQGIIVYLNSVSNQYKLRHYGDIVYFSQKMNYCILYVDQEQTDQIIQTLRGLDFVKNVEKSEGDAIDLTSSHIEQQIADLAQVAEKKLIKEQEKNTD